jgi:hypothetical protein
MIYQGLANLFLICSQGCAVITALGAADVDAGIARGGDDRLIAPEPDAKHRAGQFPTAAQRMRKVSPINSDVRSAQACARDTRLRRISGVDGNFLHKTSATQRPNDDLVTGSGRATMRV